MIEQRKSRRFDLKLPFELIRAGSSSKKTGETKNVSSSGVLFTFTSSAPIEIGESIEYLITFPKSPGAHSDVQLRCVGKVLRGERESTYAATLERYEFIRS